MLRRIIVPLLVIPLVSSVVPAQSLSPRGPAHPFTVANTRFAPDLGADVEVMDAGALLVVNEGWQGMDLNGNGKIANVVLCFYDPALGEGFSLGKAGLFDEYSPRVALVQLLEGQQGVDYNQDGDKTDTVMGVFRPGLGIDVIPIDPVTTTLAGDDWVFFSADEARNGGQDLNGDGDALDYVLEAYRISTGELYKTRIATIGTLVGDDGRCGLLADEASGGEDLNGNGTTTDRVAYLVDARTRTVRNLGLAAVDFGMVLLGRHLWFVVSEPGEAADLDGDGDALDAVVHVHDRLSGVTTNVGYSTTNFASGPVVSRGLYFFKTLEVDHGDLNGDGDIVDAIGMVEDPVALTTTNLALAVTEFDADGGIVGFGVHEGSQGADLNGDGDLLDVNVAHVFDPRTRTLTNLGLAAQEDFGFGSSGITVAGNRVFLSVSEAAQGGTDLNGDGDALDLVTQLYEGRTGVLHSLGLAASTPRVAHDLALLLVVEASQGGMDLNGDGDASDVVTFALSGRSLRPENLGLVGGSISVGNQAYAFQLLEYQVGRDLNGDGDMSDSVTQYVRFSQEKP